MAQQPAPTLADVPYGSDSDRQRLDLWKAESASPTPLVMLIHGGGWKGGDKTEDFKTSEIQPLLDAGISVAAINYRFIDEATDKNVRPPVKACVDDAVRALQTIRLNRNQWNIDPDRIGASGVSCGACMSIWLAMHDELADPKADDKIRRQSTRLRCAAGRSAQTSLDPQEVRVWMPNSIYGGHAFGFASKDRTRAEEFDLLIAHRAEVLPWIRQYSPIELASADDPPMYLDYPEQIAPPIEGQLEPDPTHSVVHGLKLAERMSPLGVEVVVAYPSKPCKKYGSINVFLISKLGATRP
jgi:acetyl esterase/lipase